MVMLADANAEFPPIQLSGSNHEQRWFMRHNAQRTDIFRGAQNVADETGISQFLYCVEELLPEQIVTHAPLIVEGVTFFLFQIVRRNPVRAQAGR